MTKTKKKSTHHKKSQPKKHTKKTIARNTVKGRGGYFGDLGRHIVGGLGDRADGFVKKITGFGDYKVKQNSISETGGPPNVRNSKHSSIVQHREYLGDVTGSTAFTNNLYPINPGVSTTFPWLAALAAGYEQYKVRGMLFEFVSTSADALNSTNTALGTVILATEYNTNLPAFNSKIQMENHEYSSTGKPSVNIMHPIECARGLTPIDELFVRTTSVQPIDPLLYDLGNFQIATVGMQAAAVIGELWVTYEIQFYKPALSTNNPVADAIHYYLDQRNNAWPGSTALTAGMKNKATGQFLPENNKLPIPSGRWIVILRGEYPSSQAAGASWSILYTDVTGVNFLNTNNFGVPSSALSSEGTGASVYTHVGWLGMVDAPPTGGYLSCNGLPSPVGGVWSTMDYFLLPVGSSFTSMPSSRRAVDYDPISVLNRRIDELILSFRSSLPTVEEDEKERYIDSDSDVLIELPPKPRSHISSSTLDLAKAIRGLVAGPPAA